jgi:hypothetical protein
MQKQQKRRASKQHKSTKAKSKKQKAQHYVSVGLFV